MTEEEVLAVIQQVARRLARKFTFGYHSEADIRQQACLFAVEGLDNYDEVRPLENFLWTHVRNRLYNYKRNNYERPDKPCFNCELYNPTLDHTCTGYHDQMECSLFRGWFSRNSSKRNLMSTIDLQSVHDENEDNMKTGDLTSDTAMMNEFHKLLEDHLPVEFREDFIRLKHNLRLPKVRRERLIVQLKQILEEQNIGSETW
jgi:DNA-directed RNA polymerase specialized sigma24 family protein